MWFLTTANYESLSENGENRKKKEKYLVDALSCTEAEARTIEHLQPYSSGELEVLSVQNKAYEELFFNDVGDYFYEATVAYITVDEKKGREKETKVKMLVQAEDYHKAIAVLDEGLKGSMADIKIKGLVETPIVEVLLYQADKN